MRNYCKVINKNRKKLKTSMGFFIKYSRVSKQIEMTKKYNRMNVRCDM